MGAGNAEISAAALLACMSSAFFKTAVPTASLVLCAASALAAAGMFEISKCQSSQNGAGGMRSPTLSLPSTAAEAKT